MGTDNKQLIKLVIFGGPKSGKSALFSRLRNLEFIDTYEKTPGVSLEFVDIDEHNIKLKITDTTGDEKYQAIIATYLTNQDIYYLVIDPTTNITAQLKQADNQIDTAIQLNTKACFVVVLTKMDLINTEAAKKTLAENLHILANFRQGDLKFSVKEVSSKNNTGITELLNSSIAHSLNLIGFASAKESTLQNVCEKYDAIIKSRHFFSTDITRYRTLRTLREKLNTANDIEDLKTYLINAARDLRTPVNGKSKYGFTFFFGRFHIGSYKNSKLYQLIESELTRLDPSIRLDKISSPPGRRSVVPLPDLRRSS
jgi:small GTP-binding protein